MDINKTACDSSFSGILQKWKDTESAVQQTGMNNKLSNITEVNVSKKIGVNSEASCKIIYNEISSVESKQKFINILNGWMEKEKSQFVTLNINQSKQTTTLDSNDNDSSEKIDDIGSEKVRPLLRYDEKNKCRYDSLPSKKLTSKKIRFADRNHKLNPYSDEISKQNSKIEQIQKALRLCSLNRHLMKCSERIVAEKMLLVETIKKGLLQQASLNSPLSLPKNSNIVIRNIRFDLKTNEADNCTHYYICLIKNGIDVVTSEIAIPIKNVIIFKKTMDIKDVHPNLVLSLYFMKVPNGERTGKNRYTSYIKKVLKKILFILSTQKTCELKQRQYSEFECVGSATLSSLTSQDPTLDVPVNSCVVEQFVAEVEVSDK